MTMTYAELKTAIQDYVSNDEATFVSHLPTMIRIAEDRILKNVRLDIFYTSDTGAMTTSSAAYTLPSDFLSPISLAYTDGSGAKVVMEFKELEYLELYAPDSTVTGSPKYYAVDTYDTLRLAPTPSADFVTQLRYIYRPASLTDGAESGTTWLSINAENALLYGCLIEAYTYMKGEEDLIKNYTARFGEAISRLKNLGEGMQTTDQREIGTVRKPRT